MPEPWEELGIRDLYQKLAGKVAGTSLLYLRDLIFQDSEEEELASTPPSSEDSASGSDE